MFDYWKQFTQDQSLERFMAALENETQPKGPPNKAMAIRLASEQLLQRQVPPADVSFAVWQLACHVQDGSTHDLALVAALYFLQARPTPEPRLDPVRVQARLLAQRWVLEGEASVAIVSRFEETLFSQFS